MSKLHSFILLLSIISLNSTYCMLSKLKYTPWVQCHNDEVSKRREEIHALFEKGEATKITDITIIRQPTEREREQDWRCFNYAIHKITGSVTPLQLHIISNEGILIKHLTSIDIEKFFDQIQGPEEGALVLYTDNANRIFHFAVVLDHVTFESKWGGGAIVQHKPFDVPVGYWNMLSFWQLKKEFTTAEGKELLLETIKNDAEDYDKKFQQSWHEQVLPYYRASFALGVILGIGGLSIFGWLNK